MMMVHAASAAFVLGCKTRLKPRVPALRSGPVVFGNKRAFLSRTAVTPWRHSGRTSVTARVRFRKKPGVAIVAIVTLALGIGANTTIFSMVDSLLLRPLPVRDAEQITTLALRQKNGDIQTAFSLPDFRDIRHASSGVFSDVTCAQVGLDGLSVNGRADRIVTAYVAGDYFSMLGLQPAAGRLILPSEDDQPGANPVIVLDYAYWKDRFGGDPGIVGRKISLDGHPLTVVGVTPKGFHGTFALFRLQAYLPLGMATVEGYPLSVFNDRASRNLSVYARLRSGAGLAQANATLGVIARRLSSEYPATDRDLGLQAFPEPQARINAGNANTLFLISGLFLGLALMVLLLACVNVGNILLVRATAREHEMAIRSALGAGRVRLIRQLLTESVLLALGGGLAGVLLGMWGSAALASLDLRVDVPINLDFHFDWRVFSYAFSAALVTGIVVGILPALRASRGSLSTALREGGRGIVGKRARLRSILVAAEVAGSLVLLVIAGLFTRSLAAAQRTDLGFNPSHVLNLTMDPQEIGYNDSQGLRFYRSLLERVRALPGVTSASVANAVPMGYYGDNDMLSIEDHASASRSAPPVVSYNVVSPGYFQTMAIPLRRGRAFTDADNETGTYVAIVSETMAKRYWPGRDPIGRRFALASDAGHPLEVVGVVRDARMWAPAGSMRPYFYVPLAQHYNSNSLATLQVRTAGAPESMIHEVESAVHAIAPDLPMFDVQTMSEALNTLNGFLMLRLGAGLAGALGMLGLVLAVVGVYGVVSFSVSQLTHEIGIRMALGARPADILRMVLRQGVFIIGAGLGIGLVVAYGASRVAGTFLTVSSTDPLTWIAVSLLLAGVALAASFLPAHRATRVDAMAAMRSE